MTKGELSEDLIKGLSGIHLDSKKIEREEPKDKEDEEDEEEEERIVSLSEKTAGGGGTTLSEGDVEYVPKGPVYRSVQRKYEPYARGHIENDGRLEYDDSNALIADSSIRYDDPGIRIFFQRQSSNAGEPSYQIIPYSFDINLKNKVIGVWTSRLAVPKNVLVSDFKIEIYVQIYPRGQNYIKSIAVVEECYDGDKPCYFIIPQFVTLKPLGDNGGFYRLLSGLKDTEVESAVGIVESKEEIELFKTYGPNNDTLLSMLCFSRDETALSRAKLLALTRKILAHPSIKFRCNLIAKNKCGINALEFAAATNKSDIAAYIAELFFYVGEDVQCTDAEGNTLLHLLARKGDIVSDTLKALLDLNFEDGRKMFPSDVRNNMGLTPMHIASRGASKTETTIQLLHKSWPGSSRAKTPNGSLPIHMACQYASDTSVITSILSCDDGVVNNVRNDGYTPLHLLASRCDEGPGGVPAMDEDSQIEAVKALLHKGAEKTKLVENASPSDLVSEERVRVKILLKISYGNMEQGKTYNDYFSLDSLNNLGHNNNNNGNDFDRRGPWDGYGDLKGLAASSPTSSSSGFESQGSPSSVNTSSSKSKPSSNETTPQHPGISHSPTEPVYQLSPTNSNHTDYGGSEEEGEEDLDAIAEVLYQHPSIRAAVTMAEYLP